MNLLLFLLLYPHLLQVEDKEPLLSKGQFYIMGRKSQNLPRVGWETISYLKGFTMKESMVLRSAFQ